jgi:hypothetical protein
MTVLARPGSPEETMFTPATRPRSASSTVATWRSCSASAGTLVTASLTVRRFCVV